MSRARGSDFRMDHQAHESRPTGFLAQFGTLVAGVYRFRPGLERGMAQHWFVAFGPLASRPHYWYPRPNDNPKHGNKVPYRPLITPDHQPEQIYTN